MNSRQKNLLKNLIFVFIFTSLMVVGLVSIKNAINKSEAIRSMQLIGKEALGYRKQYGSLPSEQFIDGVTENIRAVRLSDVNYRAQWIQYGSDPNGTILAYSAKNYKGFTKAGYVVLFLDGDVIWMGIDEFEAILNRQQQQIEIDFLREQLQKNR